MKETELELLKKIVAAADNSDSLPFDVSRIEKIIKEKIPDILEKNAPPNFPELYFDFEYLYSKFYDFLLFNQLIGKKIVALGGGFSSGKSTFLNTLLGKKTILPTDINPSTSVPAYIINGETERAGAVNVFAAKIDMQIKDVKTVAHGFGEDENSSGELTLGHLLRSIFVSTPQQPYSNIAFLDTPGYSKPDSENYSAKTDEKIARSQLNAGDYILWFIQADSGTITVDDLNFLTGLDKNIPKLFIINKADKVATQADLAAVVQSVKSALDLKGIAYEGIFTYSRLEKVNCDRDKIREVLSRLNEKISESDFAYSFKKLFIACKNFYDDSLHDAKRQLNRLNRALTFGGDIVEVSDCLNDLVADTKSNIQKLEELRQQLRDLQQEFFTEIKFVADKAGIKMPEPSEIELLEDKISNPAVLVQKMLQQRNISADEEFLRTMQRELTNDAASTRHPGGSDLHKDFFKMMKERLH